MERALIVPERDAAIIGKWREKAENKPTLAFCCSHLHADRVAVVSETQESQRNPTFRPLRDSVGLSFEEHSVLVKSKSCV